MIPIPLLKSVLLQNHSEILKLKDFQRSFQSDDGNTVFFGTRGCGKTFLLYQKIQELMTVGLSQDGILYLNCEDPMLVGLGCDDLVAMLTIYQEIFGRNTKPILFIDEIQNIPHWEIVIKRLADSGYRIYLSASNASVLSEKVKHTLEKRFKFQAVFPLSFQEYLAAQNFSFDLPDLSCTETRGLLQNHFNKFLRFGGFPQTTQGTGWRDALSLIYRHLIAEIALENKINNIAALKSMFSQLAANVGHPTSYTQLTKAIESGGVKTATSSIVNFVRYRWMSSHLS